MLSVCCWLRYSVSHSPLIAHIHLLLVTLHSAECQEITESHSEHSCGLTWQRQRLRELGEREAGAVVGVLRSRRGRRRFLGTMLVLSQWVDL